MSTLIKSLPVPTIVYLYLYIELSAVQFWASLLTSLSLFSHQKNVNSVIGWVPQEADSYLISVQIRKCSWGHHW